MRRREFCLGLAAMPALARSAFAEEVSTITLISQHGLPYLPLMVMENLKLVERFTIVDTNTLDYEFTVIDPTTFVRPWTAAIPYLRTTDQLFEYACHEGNYGMEGILLGARTEEAKAAAENKQ